jgi:hypothetical protein
MIVYPTFISAQAVLVGGRGTELPSLIGFHEDMEHSILR